MQISMGAIAPSISDQIAEAGQKHVGLMSIILIDRLAEAITLANIHGIITRAEAHRARQRLIKKLKLEPISKKEN